jgi:hypothetical protein
MRIVTNDHASHRFEFHLFPPVIERDIVSLVG